MTSQTSPEQNLPAKQSSPKRELKEWLQGETFKGELRALLPKTMSAERFVRIAFQAVHRNPQLLNCTQESFFHCLLSLGAMGLEPDGRNAHLIPFGKECTLVIDYKGIAELLRRNHDVASLHCDVVYTRDEYEAEQGTHQHLSHKRARGERGEPILAYSFVRLPDGSQEFEEMTLGEIEAIRKRSRTPDKGPWVTDWDQMARKTVFRRHAKTLPLSPETREALDRDNDADSIAFNHATPVEAAVVAAPEPVRKRGRPSTRTLAQDMAAEPSPFDEASAPVEAPPEPEKPAPQPQPAPEPTPELHDQVRQLVIGAGFTEAELLAVLIPVKMAPANATSLSQCTRRHLALVLEQWDDAHRRLMDERRKKAEAAKIPSDALL